LLEHSGKLGQYLELAKAFERADWDSQQQLTRQVLNKAIDLSPVYLEAVDWAHGLMLTAREEDKV
jgi:c-di-GMP-related signal transduction protein